METSKKSRLILWSSFAAAVGGAAAIFAVLRWRNQMDARHGVSARLRDVQDVLSDCYEKINEIEAYLPTSGLQQVSSPFVPMAKRATSSKQTNGKPVWDVS